jgi:hypothetical protein
LKRPGRLVRSVTIELSQKTRTEEVTITMRNIIYIIGLIVVVYFILKFLNIV